MNKTQSYFKDHDRFTRPPVNDITRSISFGVDEREDSAEPIFYIMHIHACLEWRHIRKYHVTESEWLKLLVRAASKYESLSISGMFFGTIEGKASLTKTFYLPDLFIPLSEPFLPKRPIITYRDIMEHDPCVDPSVIGLCDRDWEGTLSEVMQSEIYYKYKIWMFAKFASTNAIRAYAALCAEQALSTLDDVSPQVQALVNTMTYAVDNEDYSENIREFIAQCAAAADDIWQLIRPEGFECIQLAFLAFTAKEDSERRNYLADLNSRMDERFLKSNALYRLLNIVERYP